MRVLLTGATGFVGPQTAKALSDAGHQVRALVRETSDRSALDALGVELEYAIGDVCSPGPLAEAVEGVDAVIHLAGATKGIRRDDFYRVNTYGARLLAETAVEKGVSRFVHCSTLAVAGPMSEGRPVHEDDPPAPVSEYGRSKLAGEEAVRRHGGRMDVTIVRPPIVYGPRDRDFFEVFKMAARGIGVRPGLLEPKRYSIIHVDDLAQSLALALEKGRAVEGTRGGEGVYYVSDGGVHRWDELIRHAALALGKGSALVLPVPESFAWPLGIWSDLAARLSGKPQIVSLDKVRESMGPGFACSAEKAQNELGYAPGWPVERGIESTARWYLENRWL